MNRNKRSVTADLKEPRGRERVRRLARHADVVIENFRAGVAARLGVGYEDLARENPRLIYASISGFGSDGPDRTRPGNDLIREPHPHCRHSAALGRLRRRSEKLALMRDGTGHVSSSP